MKCLREKRHVTMIVETLTMDVDCV